MSLVWTILLIVIWIGLVLISGIMTLFMFAFADSPGAGKAAQKMIGPIFVIAALIYGYSAVLMKQQTLWSVPTAYLLTLSPPFLVFLGYNLLMRK